MSHTVFAPSLSSGLLFMLSASAETTSAAVDTAALHVWTRRERSSLVSRCWAFVVLAGSFLPFSLSLMLICSPS